MCIADEQDTGHNRGDHLRGKDKRGAEDAGQGRSRPDEAATGEPPGIQATHAGLATGSPEPPRHDGPGVGRDSVPNGDPGSPGRSRYSGHGRATEGAFGEEDAIPERP